MAAGADSGYPRPGRTVDLPLGAQAVEQPPGRHHRLHCGSRSLRGQGPGELLGGSFGIIFHPVNEPEGERLARVHPAAGQHQVQGRTAAGQVGQQPGAHREVGAGRADPAQPRARARDPQVRRRRQLRAAADRRPGDHGDHRSRPGDHDLAAVVDEVGDRGSLGVGDGQVRPRAEHPRVGAAEQDGHPRFCGERVPHGGHQGHVQRVTPLRPGQAQPAVAGRAVVDHQVRMRHAGLPERLKYGIPNGRTAHRCPEEPAR